MKSYTIKLLMILSIFSYLSPIQCLPSQIKIGLLLHEHQYEQEILFKWAIEHINQRTLLDRTKLVGVIRKVNTGDAWDAEVKACDLLSNGTVAIIGPLNAHTSQHVGYICDALDIPHINIVPRGVPYISQTATNIIVGSQYPRIQAIEYLSGVSVDLSVPSVNLLKACVELTKILSWTKFVYLYEQDESLYHLQEQFKGKSFKTRDLSVRVVRFEPTKAFRDQFWSLKRNGVKQIMLNVQCSNLRTVLKHAQQVSMMTEEHSYLIVCMDAHTIDLEDFKYSKARIIWFSPIDQSSESLSSLSSLMNDGSSRFFDSWGLRMSTDRLKLESSLIHDAVETLALTLKEVDSSQTIDHKSPVYCRVSKPWPFGSSIVNYMRNSLKLHGISGLIKFNSFGHRLDYILHLMRLTEDGQIKIGNWTETDGESLIRISQSDVSFLQRGYRIADYDNERDLLIVTSMKNNPYFMNKETAKLETGNSRYEGYVVDLIDELSRIVGFDYLLKEVDDNKYGNYDANMGRWNGMIYEVMSGKADLAIGDLSITSAREDAVDFTLPFMSTGISILFKKPITKEMELFSFMSPFEIHVWLYVSGAYISVSMFLFVLGRISPYEWTDPHPCRQEDRILRNQFSIGNSFWFTMAALMQQGSDLAPKALSCRLVAAMWYFFTLIMISSYTANLAAFLTVEKILYPIERAEDLYMHPQKIRYGCVSSGSTRTFFEKSRTPVFRNMYSQMTLMEGNPQGIAEVEKGNYAFFMESTSIEYTVERKCNLTQIGGLLDSKGYGIALAKNSTRKRDYRTKLSEAILSLQESGTLDILKTRWWKEKRGGGACDIDDGQGGEGVKELTLENVGGVFVVLGMGIGVSLVIGLVEVCSKSHRLPALNGKSKLAQFKKRLRFCLSVNRNY